MTHTITINGLTWLEHDDGSSYTATRTVHGGIVTHIDKRPDGYALFVDDIVEDKDTDLLVLMNRAGILFRA